jgi:hypothetical protein
MLSEIQVARIIPMALLVYPMHMIPISISTLSLTLNIEYKLIIFDI